MDLAHSDSSKLWQRHCCNTNRTCKNTPCMQLCHLADNTWMHTVQYISAGSHRYCAGLYVYRGRAIDMWSSDVRPFDKYACSIWFISIYPLCSVHVSGGDCGALYDAIAGAITARSALNRILVSTHNLYSPVGRPGMPFWELHSQRPSYLSPEISYLSPEISAWGLSLGVPTPSKPPSRQI